MTTQVDDRMTKVIAFEVGETYNGRTVESRTACFVTFEGCPRKKIAIVDGVEQVVVDPSFTITASKPIEAVDPNDTSPYSPVDGGNKLVVTDGAMDWRVLDIIDDSKVVLSPANPKKDRDGRTVKIISLTELHDINDKPTVASAEAAEVKASPEIKTASSTVSTLPNVQKNDFWTRYQVALVPDFAPDTVAAYKALTAQPDEPPIAEVEVLAASLGYQLVKMTKTWQLFRDGLLIGNELSLLAIRDRLEAELYSKRFNIEVPSAVDHVYSPALGHHMEVVRNVPHCGYERACPLAVELDEPDWFYDSEFDRQRLETALDRDCDRAANFATSFGGLI